MVVERGCRPAPGMTYIILEVTPYAESQDRGDDRSDPGRAPGPNGGKEAIPEPESGDRAGPGRCARASRPHAPRRGVREARPRRRAQRRRGRARKGCGELAEVLR